MGKGKNVYRIKTEFELLILLIRIVIREIEKLKKEKTNLQKAAASDKKQLENRIKRLEDRIKRLEDEIKDLKSNNKGSQKCVIPWSSAIGIDFGTSKCSVGVLHNGKVKIINNDQNNQTTPSYVAFTEYQRLIGNEAKNQPANVNIIFDAKRLVGRQFSDPYLQADMKHWPFTILSSDGGRPKVQVEYKGGKKTFFAEEISAMLFVKIKETAEAYLGKTINDAVVTVPACFNDTQRRAVKDSAMIAGLNVLQLMNEPTAAAVAFSFGKKVQDERLVLIFDLGGGSCDVSVLTIKDTCFEIKSTAGDTHLGGEDFDNRMVDYFVAEIKCKYEKDLTGNPRAVHRLKMMCECAKRTLSSSKEAVVEICGGLFEGMDFISTITRSQFEYLNADLFRLAVKLVEKALLDANIDKSLIDDVILVGGSANIPKIQQLLQDFFTGKELNKSFLSDEACARGAAIRAAILSGLNDETLQNLLLSDVTPFSLTVKTSSGVIITDLVKRNAKILSKVSQTFAVNGESQIIFHVYEGENPAIEENNFLGSFEFLGLSDVASIDVTFEIDSSGILTLTSDRGHIFATKNGTIGEQELKCFIRKAEEMKKEDEDELFRREAKHLLQQYAFKMKASLEDDQLKVVLSSNLRKLVLEKSDEILFWLESNPAATEEELKRKLNEAREFYNADREAYLTAGGSGTTDGGTLLQGCTKKRPIGDVD